MGQWIRGTVENISSQHSWRLVRVPRQRSHPVTAEERLEFVVPSGCSEPEVLEHARTRYGIDLRS